MLGGRSGAGRIAVVAALSLALGAACGGDGDDDSEERSTTTEESTTTTELDTTGFETFDWINPQPTAIGNGWTIADCAGEGQMLCLTTDDGRTGLVKFLRFASPAGSDLQAHALQFVEDFTADRKQGCGKGYNVVAEEREDVLAKDGPVLRYGFSGGAGGSAGSITERTIQWAGYRGDSLVLITLSAYDPGACISPEGSGTLPDLEQTLAGVEALIVKAGMPPI